MKTTTLFTTTLILAIITVTIPSVFAQGSYNEQACPDCEGDSRMAVKLANEKEIPITVRTDKGVYDHNSMITVQGTVAAIRPGTDVGLVVIGPPPFNNVIKIDQIKVGPDGKYSTKLSTAGELWKYDGTYTIRVTYGNQEIFDRVLVQLTGGIVSGPGGTTCKSNELNASGQCIPYTISGASVSNARINVGTTSMIIKIKSTDDGSITLEIPRRVLDTNSLAEPFFVLVDGEEVDAEEMATQSKRTVTIPFHAGAEEIEIIGTFAIPEFGVIAVLILAIAIVAIVTLSSKSRLSLLPKQ